MYIDECKRFSHYTSTKNMNPILCTIGYQGIRIQDFVASLAENNVYLLVDVREKPWSNRRDYIKTILKSHLQSAGIDYLHMQPAGNPSSIRKSSVSLQECLELYEDYLDQNRQCISDIIELMKKDRRNICLLCYENNPKECHRSVIVKKVKEENNTVTIKHLNTDCCNC